jgi:DNA-binding IclR family transcriptional regulator
MKSLHCQSSATNRINTMLHSPDVLEGGTDGTQALRRAAAILRRIGQGGVQGAALTEIARALELPRSTTHRILKCLTEEGLVRHDQNNRRYLIGQLTYELALTVTTDTVGVGRWRVAVDRIAERTGATCYLMARSGIEATCLLKAEGNSAIRVIPVDVGQRRFLGVGAGATALLAALDARTSDRIIKTIAPSLHLYNNLSESTVRKIVEQARKTGFAVSRSNMLRDAIGIGIAIPDPDHTASLALSIAALASSADQKIIEKWKQILRQEIASVLQTDPRTGSRARGSHQDDQGPQIRRSM